MMGGRCEVRTSRIQNRNALKVVHWCCWLNYRYATVAGALPHTMPGILVLAVRRTRPLPSGASACNLIPFCQGLSA